MLIVDASATNHIGIREFKAHLSRHLKRVQAGARLVVTDRGRSIATIAPIEPEPARAWVHLASFAELVRRGGAGDTVFSRYNQRLDRASRTVL